MNYLTQFPRAMDILGGNFPWHSLATMLNTLLLSCEYLNHIGNSEFPLPEKDNFRPFPEDFAMRGLLWAANYFPQSWFLNKKMDEEEKYHELPSMLAQRKERILWLACRIASSSIWMQYESTSSFSVAVMVPEPLQPRSLTFASATTESTDSSSTAAEEINEQSDFEEDLTTSTIPAAETSTS